MKKFFLALAALSLSFTAFAAGDDDAFYGKIEKMPSAQNPTWVIGGKTFKADAEFFISEMEIKNETRCHK